MLVKTHAIVLNSIKYGDSGKIVKFFTQNHGIKSCIAKSVYAKKNRINPLLVPFNFVELVYDEKPNQSLFFIKEINPTHHFNSIHQQPAKTTIVLFLAEILHAVLKEEESNLGLFRFLENSISNFDKKENAYSDFHLWFLFHLTSYLGFYPNLENSARYFDLTHGISSDQILSDFSISDEELLWFKKISELDFLHQTSNQFNQNQRKSLLSVLLKYFELHISDFRQPKSLEILNRVFE